MTKERIWTAISGTFSVLGNKVETDEDMKQALIGIGVSLYNKGIEDAVDAMGIEGLSPDDKGFYFPSERGDDYPILTLNKEEVLKLKID